MFKWLKPKVKEDIKEESPDTAEPESDIPDSIYFVIQKDGNVFIDLDLDTQDSVSIENMAGLIYNLTTGAFNNDIYTFLEKQDSPNVRLIATMLDALSKFDQKSIMENPEIPAVHPLRVFNRG